MPNYGIFDEYRYFNHGPEHTCIIKFKNYKIGLCICEDIWQPGPVDRLIQAKVDNIICINASPFDVMKFSLREQIVRSYAKQGVAIIYVNNIGGQDELIFDGQSFVMNKNGNVSARAPAFQEALYPIYLDNQAAQGEITPLLEQTALIYQALLCGIKDYVEKNGFPGVLLGLSGGIDSALTLALAVDALGADKVHAIMMPSRFTAKISRIDAEKQAKLLQVKYTVLSIEKVFKSLLSTLHPIFKDLKPDVTEENIQARIRQILLMGIANKQGKMLLSTSNKSETAVGYCTLYGDMAGGFAPLKDVLKSTVYNLANYRNSIAQVIPLRVLKRAPSAELAKNQKDLDSLPSYTILDAIIQNYMENNLDAAEIIKLGYAKKDVTKVINLIKHSEYKRRQAPPGIKISTCAFGKDWRYPITSGFTNL